MGTMRAWMSGPLLKRSSCKPTASRSFLHGLWRRCFRTLDHGSCISRPLWADHEFSLHITIARHSHNTQWQALMRSRTCMCLAADAAWLELAGTLHPVGHGSTEQYRLVVAQGARAAIPGLAG